MLVQHPSHDAISNLWKKKKKKEKLQKYIKFFS